MSLYAYVAIAGEDKVKTIVFDPDERRVEHRNEVAVGGEPAILAASPDCRYLYVSGEPKRDPTAEIRISSFEVDRKTGGLKAINVIPLDFAPVHLSTDRTGRFLLSAYYQSGRVAVHPIADGGRVGPAVQWEETGRGAHFILTDPSNRFAFVPHVAAPGCPNMIVQYRFDEATGRLSPNSPDKVVAGEGVGPRHYCFHPKLGVVYVSNEQDNSVTAYRLDTSLGTLTAFQTVSSLPAGYEGQSSCSGIRITPSGAFVYVPNRGHDSIACFATDPSTGELRLIATVPTEANPRELTLDPKGNYLCVVGQDSDRVAFYAVGRDGVLQLLASLSIGRSPMAVLMVEAPA